MSGAVTDGEGEPGAQAPGGPDGAASGTPESGAIIHRGITPPVVRRDAKGRPTPAALDGHLPGVVERVWVQDGVVRATVRFNALLALKKE